MEIQEQSIARLRGACDNTNAKSVARVYREIFEGREFHANPAFRQDTGIQLAETRQVLEAPERRTLSNMLDQKGSMIIDVFAY